MVHAMCNELLSLLHIPAQGGFVYSCKKCGMSGDLDRRPHKCSNWREMTEDMRAQLVKLEQQKVDLLQERDVLLAANSVKKL